MAILLKPVNHALFFEISVIKNAIELLPILPQSSYQPPLYLRNGHWATIVPSMFRQVRGITYERERIRTTDDDFLDLDWVRGDHDRVIVVSHGLEGSSDRHYVLGIASYFSSRGYDVLAWNCRSCSGEINRKPRFYHHGDIEDIALVIGHAQKKYSYRKIVLVGFSLGGSMTLNYLGLRGADIAETVVAAVAFSVPCDLASSARELSQPHNWFYLRRFLKKLRKKLEAKALLFPHEISLAGFEEITSFREFDARYTAPLHGFDSAEHFYQMASASRHLHAVQIPTLIVNALNDPFLPECCYPYDITRRHHKVFLETPRFGGHVGFSLTGRKENWMEERAFGFLSQY